MSYLLYWFLFCLAVRLLIMGWFYWPRITTWAMFQWYMRVSPFYHRHRYGEPYDVPMEENYVNCMICDRAFPVSRTPEFSATNVVEDTLRYRW